MKKQLYIYALGIVAFIAFNLFYQPEDKRISTAINILFASILFLYIAYIAWSFIRKINNRKNQ